MAYYEGDPNNQNAQQDQNGQQFQQEPQGQQFQQEQQGQQFQQGGPQQQYQQQQYQQTSQGYNVVDAGPNPTKIMVFGIISVACGSIIGWAPILVFSIVAIVFGALAMSWSKKYNAVNPTPNGKVKAGRITGIIGLIFGIITAVYSLVYWIVVGCAAALGYY